MYLAGDEDVLSGLPIYNKIEPITHGKNQDGLIRINKIPLFDADGKIIGIVGNYTDVVDPQFYGVKNIRNKKNIALTKRQIDVLVCLASGMSAKQIANELEISHRTVEHYIESLKIKLNCDNKAKLIVKALTIGIVVARLK